MLIETNSKKNIGTIIYSENKFDFVTNFTKVDKSEPDIQEKIDFKEVSNFISKPVDKNIILYRLITNDENLNPFSSKLGYFIKIKNKMEVVYFDPIFILNDIVNLKFTIPKKEFRYKIQQVGYRTISIEDEIAIYEERFSINMSEIEAKNQNDSLFVESMLSVKGSLNIKKVIKSVNKEEKEVLPKPARDFKKKNNKFYRLDGNDKRKNSTYVGKLTKEENSGFFSRVKLRKDKDEYDSNSLKMFK